MLTPKPSCPESPTGVQSPSHPGAGDDLGLWYFQTDPTSISNAIAAGITTFVVDWEHRGKAARQAGRDTEINRDTVADLYRVSAIPGTQVACRINRFSSATGNEVEMAVEGGASIILLPMVEDTREVEAFLSCIGGRSRAGILIETRKAVDVVEDLARLPLSVAYIGLNDLSISLGTRSIFSLVLNGVVERIANTLVRSNLPFGWAGITLVDAGMPIPCRLLMAELARLHTAFSFLRRSFRRDSAGRDLLVEVGRIQELWHRLRLRNIAEIGIDRAELYAAIQHHGELRE